MDCGKTAEDILQAVRVGGADMGECTVSNSETTEVYYESGKISMVRSVLNHTAAIKVIRGRKKGSVTTNACDAVSVNTAVADAFEAAAHAPEDSAEGVAELKENRAFAAGERRPDRERLYTLLREFLDTVRREYPKISFDSVSVGHSFREKVYRNTNGVELREAKGFNEFEAMFMAKDGETTSSFNYFGVCFDELDTPLIERGMARTLLAETERQLQPETLHGKFEGDLIITPACLPTFLYYAQSNFLSDGVLIDGTSIWKDALDTPVASELLTWRSLPESGGLPGASRLTGDGYTAKDMAIIENGILKNFCLTRYGAAKTGLTRSANTQDCYVVEPGERSLEEMIASVENGLLLNRFSGGNPSPNGDFSGVAKNSFLIRNGKIAAAVSETMISGNIAALLKNIVAVSRERVSDGMTVVPWVKAADVTISGK